jgi:hypothetical protein
LEKISVAISASIYNVRNATCGNICNTCNGATALSIFPTSMMLQVHGTGSASAQLTMSTGSNASGTSNIWSTTNTSVATGTQMELLPVWRPVPPTCNLSSSMFP